MTKTAAAPYAHSEKSNLTRGAEWLVALAPMLIWSVYMFGARVITLCTLSGGLSLLFDFLVRRYLFKYPIKSSLDIMASVYGVLAAFSMPVAVPLWIPMISAILVVIAKNIRVIFKKRLFNPFVFSAAVLNLLFGTKMTLYTRPFAYFSAFDFSIDEKLLSGYRVISPLQYMADGSVYEDGIFAQLYGFASGNIGEIAIFAMILSLVWLCIRKEADWKNTVAYLVPVFLLALCFPSDDAESTYYAFAFLFSGAFVFLSVFATSESCTTPMTKSGKLIFSLFCGVITFALRKLHGGIEWGYYAVLLMNVISPLIEFATKPKVSKAKKDK